LKATHSVCRWSKRSHARKKQAPRRRRFWKYKTIWRPCSSFGQDRRADRSQKKTCSDCTHVP